MSLVKLRLGASGLAAALCLAAAAGLVGLHPAKAEGGVDAIKERGALRVGAAVYPPFMIRKPDGTYEGSDVDLLNQLATDMGVKLVLVDTGWDTVVEGIVTGKWDLVPGICITPKRAEVIDFSNKYMDVGGVLGIKPDSTKIKTLEDANNPDVVIADVAGSWNEQLSKQVFPKAQHKAFAQVTQADTVQEILSGRADAAVFDSPVTSADIAAKFGPEAIKFLPAVDKPIDALPCPVAYGVKKGDAQLKAYIDKFFEQKQSSGELAALFKKWLVPDKINPQ